MVLLADATPVFIASGIEQDFKITPEQLEAAITDKTRAIILCSPSNPTGSVYSRQELEALKDVLMRHEQVIVIADEIYEHINYIGEHASIAQFPEIKDRVVIVNGVSKAYAMTGWRIGFIAAPEWIVKGCNKLQGQYTSGPCSISQKAAEAALNNAGLSRSQVSDVRVEYDSEDGLIVYEVEFTFGGTEYEYDINAVTGEILSHETESADGSSSSDADDDDEDEDDIDDSEDDDIDDSDDDADDDDDGDDD
jgi:aspartate aminotransferase